MISKELKSIYNKYALLDKGDIFEKMEEYDRFIVYRHFRYLEFHATCDEDLLLNPYNDIDLFCIDLCINNDIRYYEKKYNSLKTKISRYRKIIDRLMSKYNNCFFITLTFNDTNYKANYTTKELKSLLSDFNKYRYIFNRDYGSVNDRFHLHGLIFTNDQDITFNWDKGFYYIEKVSEGSSNVLSHYLNKLCYHIFKINTKYHNILNIK